MVQRFLSHFGRYSGVLRTGVLGGAAIALASLPLVVPAGLGVMKASQIYQALPTQLRDHQVGQTSYVYANDGKTLITMFYDEHRKFVPLSTVSPNVTQAVLAAEDARFYQHMGVDVKSIARAFLTNRREGEVAQGASTLTMQYVRMSLRDSARTPEEAIQATEQTPERKLTEIRLAIKLEGHWSKNQIMEGYLNMAYFGHRAYGIYAASQIYFSKEPKDLTLVEAATLAGLVKAPSSFDPANQPQAALDRRNYVIRRMAELKEITPEQATAATASPIKLKLTEPSHDCSSVPTAHRDWGFFCDFFKSWWSQQAAFGTNPNDRMDELRTGGYQIVTSLDPKLQAFSEQDVISREPLNSKLAYGNVVVQPGTGRVISMAVNRVYSLDQSGNGANSDPYKQAAGIKGSYPNTVAPLLGGGNISGYQAGSTFKMFTMLAALDSGMKMSKSFYAPQRYVSQYVVEPGGPAACGNRWCPSNASGSMTGKQNMYTGFGKSVNTYFVQLEQAVGADKAVRMAEKLGLSWHNDVDRSLASPARAPGWGSFTLGVADTTPLEMANAYATVAAEGMYCKPSPVMSIKAPTGEEITYKAKDGKTLKAADPQCTRVFSQDVGRAATDAARCVTGYKAAKGSCGDWSTGSIVYGLVGRPVAGKTGTTDNTQAAWFVGFTPDLAAASFIADPDNTRNAATDGNYNKPLEAVANSLRTALEGKPVRDFNPPSTAILD
ncbi:penicillin-binding protein [Catellatospora sp. TT07R-123]|uniref:transglycosylase domain-containing protein n=1 Tax=Catellatospora sp. TT07R-123 TaxID=2733863 RepID=UPI001B0436E6|nr:penicillin-binding protein [Catellatospora sp. TT07R-123]